MDKRNIAEIAMKALQQSYNNDCKDITVKIPGNNQEILDFLVLLCQEIDSRNYTYYTAVEYNDIELSYTFTVCKSDIQDTFIWDYDDLFQDDDSYLFEN